MRTRWAAIGAAVAVSVGGGGMVWMASAATDTGIETDTYSYLSIDKEDVSVYVPITPCRLLDTRDGTIPSSTEKYYRGIYYGQIGATSSQGANFTGTNNVAVFFDPAEILESKNITNNGVTTSIFGDCKTQIDAMPNSRVVTAVVANLTVTDIETASYLTLYPASTAIASKPYISNITVYPASGQAKMNEIIIPLGASTESTGDYANRRAFRVYNEFTKGYVNVIIDVVGYYYSQQIVADITGSNP